MPNCTCLHESTKIFYIFKVVFFTEERKIKIIYKHLVADFTSSQAQLFKTFF